MELKEALHYYLPYKLMIQYYYKQIVMNLGEGSSNNWIGLKAVIRRSNENVKPILIPLAKLTEEIEENGIKIIPFKELCKLTPLELDYSERSGQWMIETNRDFAVSINVMRLIDRKLLSWHFDIFGLINQGLAIEKK